MFYLQYIPRITHETVALSVETDLDDGSTYFAAKVFCCFCNENSSVRQYGRSKKDGSKGAERWVISNFDTHMRTKHGRIATSRSESENKILKFFGKTNKSKESLNEPNEHDVVTSDEVEASGEELSRSRQERVLLEKKSSLKSSSGKTQEAGGTKTKEIDTAQ